MSSGAAKLFAAAALAINCILWAQSRYAQVEPLHHPSPAPSLWNNWNPEVLRNGTHYSKREVECAPLSYPIELQCAHVQDACETSETILSIPYLQDYFCTAPPIRPVKFGLLLLWLVFLFSFIGITASDFFCINIATIANVFGLSENVAGVTFLAFGNGSPDLFATFSAMRNDSGSLAIGELVGAASFIISVVVGCMCIVKPFHVPRIPFLRDVGFFTLSVAMLLFFLSDGELKRWEAAVLVVVYAIYAFVVIVGTWWSTRLGRIRLQEDLVRSEFREDDETDSIDSYRDEEPLSHLQTPGLLAPSSNRIRSRSTPPARPFPSPMQLDIPVSATARNLSRKSSFTSPYTPNLPSFSLLGALEFREVINALQRDSTASYPHALDRPTSPLSMRHSWLHGGPRSPLLPTADLEDRDPFETGLGLQLNVRPAGHLSPPTYMSRSLVIDTSRRPLPSPIISVTPADSPPSSLSSSPTASIPPLPSSSHTLVSPPPTQGQHAWDTFVDVWSTLFPTLQSLSKKTCLSKVTSIVAAPAVFLLTITVPVVITSESHDTLPEGKPPALGIEVGNPSINLITAEQDGLSQVLETEAELHREIPFNVYLAATQCVLGPLLCTAVLFGTLDDAVYWYAGAGILGISAAALVVVISSKSGGKDPITRTSLCLMGFCVAMVWIMAIADEVVRVLQTFGLMFGLSDAIIGLTVFAIGNSLADLVANVTVAAFAPIMGFAACIGSPMLNMLLGIGVSGSIVIHQTGESYPLNFSKTLFVSCVGLLVLLVATLIFVPMNGYLLSKGWGVGLIAAYTVLMAVNVVVEILEESPNA